MSSSKHAPLIQPLKPHKSQILLPDAIPSSSSTTTLQNTSTSLRQHQYIYITSRGTKGDVVDWHVASIGNSSVGELKFSKSLPFRRADSILSLDWLPDYDTNSSQQQESSSPAETLFVCCIDDKKLQFWKMHWGCGSDGVPAAATVGNQKLISTDDVDFRKELECDVGFLDAFGSNDSSLTASTEVKAVLNGLSVVLGSDTSPNDSSAKEESSFLSQNSFLLLYDLEEQHYTKYMLPNLRYLWHCEEDCGSVPVQNIYFQKLPSLEKDSNEHTRSNGADGLHNIDTASLQDFSIVRLHCPSLSIHQTQYKINWHCFKNKRIHFMHREEFYDFSIIQTEDNMLFLLDERGNCVHQHLLDARICSAHFLSNIYSLHHDSLMDSRVALSFINSSEVHVYQLHSLECVKKITMSHPHPNLYVGEFIDSLEFGQQLLALSLSDKLAPDFKIWVQDALVDNKLCLPEELEKTQKDNHLFSVARAMKTQEEELMQQTASVERLIHEKESIIKHQQRLMTNLLFDCGDDLVSNTHHPTQFAGLSLHNGKRMEAAQGFSSIESMSSRLASHEHSSNHSSFSLLHKDYQWQLDSVQMQLCVRFINVVEEEKIIIVPHCSNTSIEFSVHQQKVFDKKAIGTMDLWVLIHSKLPPFFGDDFVIDFQVAQHNTKTHRKIYRYLTSITPTPERKIEAFIAECTGKQKVQDETPSSANMSSSPQNRSTPSTATRIQYPARGCISGSPWNFNFIIHCDKKQGVAILNDTLLRKAHMESISSANSQDVIGYQPIGSSVANNRSAMLRVAAYLFQDHILVNIISLEENSEFVVGLLHLLRKCFPDTVPMYPYAGSEHLLTQQMSVCKSLCEEIDTLQESLEKKSFNVGEVKRRLFEKQSQTEALYASFLRDQHLFMRQKGE